MARKTPDASVDRPSRTGPPFSLLLALAAAVAPFPRLEASCQVYVHTTPRPGTTQARLYAVAALSATDAWAVGEVYRHWDGTAWSIVAGPSSGMRAIHAIASDDVWAVGRDIQHWDGARWSVVTSPALPPGSYLYGIAGAAPDDLWAVGSLGNWTDGTPLIEHWDGVSWSIVPSLPPGTGFLASVAVAGASEVWAVGNLAVAPSFNQQAMSARWDGVSWSLVPVPAIPDAISIELNSVTTTGTGEAWAVGSYILELPGSPQPVNEYGPLMLHWDGFTWNRIAAPWDPSQWVSLFGVTAAAVSDVRAVGGPTFLVAFRWDGREWCADPVPRFGPEIETLVGAAAIPAGGVWAVGFSSELNRGLSIAALDASAGTLRDGYVGNRLRAARIPGGSGVHMDWSRGPVVPRDYNLYRETSKLSLSPPASPAAATQSGFEVHDDAAGSGGSLDFYRIFGRNLDGTSRLD